MKAINNLTIIGTLVVGALVVPYLIALLAHGLLLVLNHPIESLAVMALAALAVWALKARLC